MDKYIPIVHNVLDALSAVLLALPAVLRLVGQHDKPWAARAMKAGNDFVGAFKGK